MTEQGVLRKQAGRLWRSHRGTWGRRWGDPEAAERACSPAQGGDGSASAGGPGEGVPIFVLGDRSGKGTAGGQGAPWSRTETEAGVQRMA